MLALVIGTGLGACGRDEPRPAVPRTGQNDEGAAHPTPHATGDADGVRSSDQAITAKVKTRLAADGRLGALPIDVSTNAGQVALRGTAPDTGTRTHATQVALGVDGVAGVRNGLSVQLRGP